MLINDIDFREDEGRVAIKGRSCHVCGAQTCAGMHLPECQRCAAVKALLRDMRGFRRVVERKIPVVRSRGEKLLRKAVKSRSYKSVLRLCAFSCLVLLAPIQLIGVL